MADAETTEVDFQELLDTDASEMVKPPPKPSGEYRLLVKDQELIKSRDKGTPGVQFTFTKWEPMATVDVDKWKQYCDSPAIDPDKLSEQEVFWWTKKSGYRLKEFCLKCIGYDGDPNDYKGPMGKLIADAVGQTIIATVVQQVSRNTGAVYNEITGYAKDE